MSDSPTLKESYAMGQGTPLRDSGRAILFRVDGYGEIWVPKSQIHDESEIWKLDQEPGELVVTEWWAGTKGWV